MQRVFLWIGGDVTFFFFANFVYLSELIALEIKFLLNTVYLLEYSIIKYRPTYRTSIDLHYNHFHMTDRNHFSNFTYRPACRPTLLAILFFSFSMINLRIVKASDRIYRILY